MRSDRRWVVLRVIDFLARFESFCSENRVKIENMCFLFHSNN